MSLVHNTYETFENGKCPIGSFCISQICNAIAEDISFLICIGEKMTSSILMMYRCNISCSIMVFFTIFSGGILRCCCAEHDVLLYHDPFAF